MTKRQALAALLHMTGTCDSPKPTVHDTHMGGGEIVNACEWQAKLLAERGVIIGVCPSCGAEDCAICAYCTAEIP